MYPFYHKADAREREFLVRLHPVTFAVKKCKTVTAGGRKSETNDNYKKKLYIFCNVDVCKIRKIDEK